MTFDRALAWVLRWEGGYSDHPDDPGGATNMGITQSTYDAWRSARGLPRRSVRDITRDEVAQIYRERYWQPTGCDGMPPALALMAFDCAVNQGPGKARELLEQSGRDWRVMAAMRLEHYASLQRLWPVFGRGWARRLADCVRECARLDLLGAQQVQPTRLFLDGEEVRVRKISLVGDKVYAVTTP